MTRVWQRRDGGYWSPESGDFAPPADYVFFAAEKTVLTCRTGALCEAAGRVMYQVLVKERRYSSTLGFLAPQSLLCQAQAETAASADERAQRRAASQRARPRRYARQAKQILARTLELYPSMPEEARDLVSYAWDVGSGRVSRATWS